MATARRHRQAPSDKPVQSSSNAVPEQPYPRRDNRDNRDKRETSEGPSLLSIPAAQLAAMMRDVNALQRRDEHWIGGWKSFDVDDRAGSDRVASIVWMDRDSRLVRVCNLVPIDEAREALVLELFAAMADPLPGCDIGLPTELSVPCPAMQQLLTNVLEPLGIKVTLVDAAELEEAFLDVAATLAYGDLAYLHVPGVKPSSVARFYEQAATLWQRAPFHRTSATQLFSVSGLTPFPVMVSMSREDGEAWVRIYRPHLDHVLADILSAPDPKGLHVLFLTFAREGDMQPAFFEEAREQGWMMPAPDVVPLLSAADHSDGLKPPEAGDFDLATDILEALLKWNGEGPLDGRVTHTLGSGRRIQIAWPVHVPI